MFSGAKYASVATDFVQQVLVARFKPKLVLLVSTRGAHKASTCRELGVVSPFYRQGLLHVKFDVRAVFVQNAGSSAWEKGRSFG